MLIASCTSYPKRIANLPTVIGTILNNTCPPDKVIINLSREEFPNEVIPEDVQHFVDANKKVHINWVDENWKVYKKFLPILKDYPNDLIVSFDDDTLYPEGIIEDLMNVHKQHPNSPVAANHYWFDGLKCHCGECSLTEARFFEGWEEYVNKRMIEACPADDIFYTNLAAINGYFYVCTETDYPSTWEKYNEVSGYSAAHPGINRHTSNEVYKLFGRRVKKVFSEDATKPICVFNVVDCPRGLDIQAEMLQWIAPNYNTFIVLHDGTKFEYYGLKFLQTYVAHNEVDVPVLYIHTKGAIKVRLCSEKVRNLWRFEFGKNIQKYVELVNKETPTIATPYAGYAKDPRPGYEGTYPVSWYNGWMANPAALKLIDVPLSSDRYVYETCIYTGIEILGTRCTDVWWTPESMKAKDDDLNANF